MKNPILFLKPGRFLAYCMAAACVCLLPKGGHAQRVVNYEVPATGEIHLSEGISIPRIPAGYTLWLPDSAAARGMLVFTHPRRDTLQSDALIDYALSKELAVLYATTDNLLEFFFEEEKLREVETYIHQVLSDYRIPRANLLYAGMSLEGTRALKLAIFARTPASTYQLWPLAIALCDAPLDMVRFHREMVKARDRKITPLTANEGSWVSAVLETHLGGTPADTLQAYIHYSPYCYVANGGQYLQLFRHTAIRAYTEPDVQWWMRTRGKDYYGMNALDLAAFINELRLLGNEKAELILTYEKGYLPNGERHPHSWSIVDERELIDWFLEEIANSR